MGLATVFSRACAGVEAPQVTVEVHLSGGLPKFQIVGNISPNARTGLNVYVLPATASVQSVSFRPEAGIYSPKAFVIR